MNLERLRAVQAEEREADSLRALPDSFYREVADYIEELRDERARAADAAADPFDSAEVRRLTDEIENAEEVAEAIYERRVGKLVKRASLAAAGMPADEEGLTAEEAELFSTLVDHIEAHREDVLATFDGDREGTGGVGAGRDGPADGEAADRDGPVDRRPDAEDTVDGAESHETPGGASPGQESGSDAGPTTVGESGRVGGADSDESVHGVEDESDADADEGPDPEGTRNGGDTERLTLRITRDVGEVFGVDERVYDLSEEDVVTLPSANAKPLLERDAAERID